MIVDGSLHQTSQTKVVHNVDIEKACLILTLLRSPVIQKDFNSLSKALGAGNVQSVTTIRIDEVYVDISLKEQLNHIDLVFACRNQKGVASEVIRQVAIGVCEFYQIIHKHVVCAGRGARVEQGVISSLVSLNLDVDEQVEVFFIETFPRLRDNLLNCFDIPHDASNHQSCQLFNPNFTCLEISDQHAFIQENCILALKCLVDVQTCFEACTGGCTRQLVLPRIGAHDFFLLFLGLWSLEEAIATQYFSPRLERLRVITY